MCPIYMDSFTWQVAATFFAAGLAGLVGWRQVGIAARQAEIAAGQREIAKSQAETAAAAFEIAKSQALTAKLAQRSNLFDRRYAVFLTVQEYIQASMAGNPMTLLDLDKKVNEALNRARFLFPDTINVKLFAAFELSDEVAMLHIDRRTEDSEELRKKLRKRRSDLRSILGTLAETMGAEMRLHFNEDG